MKDHLNKRAFLLSCFTVSYNILEGIASVFVGYISGSIALVAFGFDSFIESLSGSIMIWRFKNHETISEKEEEIMEKKAIRYISYSFFILGAYVLFESVKSLYFHEPTLPSLFGIIITVASIIIMPVLFYLKYKTGKDLKSKSLVADSKQTLACVMMSITVLISLVVNYFYGIWWIDSVAGIIIAGFLLKEGYQCKQEEKVCCC